jgi:hypothetical protein
MRQVRSDAELKRKNEIHEIEERKNAHINDLIRKHDAAFQEMKAYYNDITANNLELIKSLKEQLEEMKKKESSDQKLMLEVTMENKRLTEPLQKAQKEVQQLRHELQNYAKDKESLQASKARIKNLEADLKSLRWEHEVLEQRFAKVQQERDELYDKFVASIFEVQQKSGLKNAVLEKKLETLNHELETRELQLSQLVATVNLDPEDAATITKRAQELMEEKDAKLLDQTQELTRLRKANADLIRVYEAKLGEYGIPTEDLGFQPNTTISSVPANLVS